MGIFVFKDSLIDSNVRGCILTENDSLPPLILVNSNDDKKAELFTLLHEFGHYLIDEEDIDDSKDFYSLNSIEKWCNTFAFSFLITPEIESLEKIFFSNKDTITSREFMNYFSKKYKVSKHAFVIRLLEKKIIEVSDYKRFLELNPFKRKKETTKSKSGGNYYNTLGTRISRRFVSLVYENYVHGNLSLRDTLDFLKVRNSDRMERLVAEAPNG